MRDRMRSISATVTNLRARIDARACIAVATSATVLLFACLGLMYVPGIIISGLTALVCAALATGSDLGSDIDEPVGQEGGAL